MIKECNVSELNEQLKQNKNIQLIDCRELAEWNEAHISEAKFLPLSELEAKFSSILTDKNSTIIVQCRSGARSMRACLFLLDKGYTDLTNLKGGIMSWIQEDFPVISE